MPHYTIKRQLDDYYEKFYTRLASRHHLLAYNRYVLAGKLAAWKKRISNLWDGIEIKSVDTGRGQNTTIETGKEYQVTVIVNEKGLDDAVGIKCVVVHQEDGLFTFRGCMTVNSVGAIKLALRMYSKKRQVALSLGFLPCQMVLKSGYGSWYG